MDISDKKEIDFMVERIREKVISSFISFKGEDSLRAYEISEQKDYIALSDILFALDRNKQYVEMNSNGWITHKELDDVFWDLSFVGILPQNASLKRFVYHLLDKKIT